VHSFAHFVRSLMHRGSQTLRVCSPPVLTHCIRSHRALVRSRWSLTRTPVLASLGRTPKRAPEADSGNGIDSGAWSRVLGRWLRALRLRGRALFRLAGQPPVMAGRSAGAGGTSEGTARVAAKPPRDRWPGAARPPARGSTPTQARERAQRGAGPERAGASGAVGVHPTLGIR